MFKAQLRFQKILSIGLLVLSALVFVYALGMLTDVYPLYYAQDPELGVVYVDGAELFFDMQEFNSQILTCGLILIFAAVSILITNGHVRRNYYIGNFITIGLTTAANLAVSVFALIGIEQYRARFVQVDFDALKEFAEKRGTIYSDSTFWFDIGFAMCALLIVAAGLLVLNLIWKLKLMKAEKQLLSNTNGEVVAQ